jgi:hypothetical protein
MIGTGWDVMLCACRFSVDAKTEVFSTSFYLKEIIFKKYSQMVYALQC